MEHNILFLLIICALFLINLHRSYPQTVQTIDDLEHHIHPEDLRDIMNILKSNKSVAVVHRNEADDGETSVPDTVDCFGLGSWSQKIFSFFNLKPDTSEAINTHFFFTSRRIPSRVQVLPGAKFDLELVDFDPKRKTVMIVHGFMSHSNASWVNDMAEAFLKWSDVNFIAVDWSRGGNTWKYWRAVANTRRVGSDVTEFLKQLIKATGAKKHDFHFIGHSLGAHIAAYTSFYLGKVARITGLDPAQPCFRTTDTSERLDDNDADFVDIIHTNGRLLSSIGFGFPDPIGHADFYPNGGMNQPGCQDESNSLLSTFLPIYIELQQSICSHGRAYLFFTESLINDKCKFLAQRWDLTYAGISVSLNNGCKSTDICPEMGIRAVGEKTQPKAKGTYFVLTNDKEPYCSAEKQQRSLVPRY